MKANIPKLSVVVPVYNLRNYLDFTLKNIVIDQFSSMAPTDWELILVDDGSTDGSADIIKKWIAKFPDSIKLIEKQNGGPSDARNAGFAASTGEYVYFCDGDDIIKRNSLNQIVNKVLPLGADMVKIRLEYITEEQYQLLKESVPEAESIQPSSSMSVRDYLILSNGMVTGYTNNVATYLTFYRRGFLSDNKLKYEVGMNTGEDELFTWNAILKASTIIDIDVPIYMYHLRASSISHPDDKRSQFVFDVNRIEFACKMQGVIAHLKQNHLVTSEILEDIRDVYRYIYYGCLASFIVNTKAPIFRLYGLIKSYKRVGGKVYPRHIKLKPYYDPKLQPFRVKLRRIIAAYILDR